MRKRSSGSSARGRADEREAYNAALWTVFSSDLHGCQVDLPSAASGHGSGVGKPTSPRRTAGGKSRQQLGPSGAGHGAAHGLPAPCHGQGGTVPESHSGMGHPGGGRIPREPGRCGHSSGENRHPDHSERSKSADLPGGHHRPKRHRQGGRPAGPRPQRRGGDRRPYRRHSGAGVCGRRKADLPPDTHHHRPALYAGIYRPPGDRRGNAEDRG